MTLLGCNPSKVERLGIYPPPSPIYNGDTNIEKTLTVLLQRKEIATMIHCLRTFVNVTTYPQDTNIIERGKKTENRVTQ
jgi:hypothetical protein